MVAKNMTHLFQPLELSTNGSVKKMKKGPFNNYFSSCKTTEMMRDSDKDPATIEIDLNGCLLSSRDKLCAQTKEKALSYLSLVVLSYINEHFFKRFKMPKKKQK